MLRVSYDEMRGEFLRVLLKYEFRQDKAELCARLFADTSLDGVYSHGLNRFPRFIAAVQRGEVLVDEEAVCAEQAGLLERWDGRRGPGPVNAWKCMGRAIEAARENGMGCVALRNTNHWMRAGSYGRQAADAGCLGICWTNTMPLMPPWGGTQRRLGNNPLVIAVPRAEGHIVLDMAMSQFSGGRLETARLRGETLPVDGGYDQAGNLTRDPQAISASNRPLPIGYWKGAGLALMLDLVAALLSGGDFTYDIGRKTGEYGVSQVFMAFDLSRLGTRAELLDETIEYVHSSATVAEGGKIMYPGERTMIIRRENLEQGIPAEERFWRETQEL